MATIPTSNISVAVVKEVTPGTTPTTPGYKTLDAIPGTYPKLTADVIRSQLLKPKRSTAPSRKVNYRITNGVRTEVKQDAAFEMLLESAVGGTFTTGVLKAGDTDTHLTIERNEKSTAGTTYTYRALGCLVEKFNLSGTSTTIAQVAFDVIGLDEATTPVAGATYADAANVESLAGPDATISIDGLTGLEVTSFELDVSHSRKTRTVIGQLASTGISTDSGREVTLKVTAYREDLSATTLLSKNDNRIAVSLSIGGVGEGFTFELPEASYDEPDLESADGDEMVTMTFMGHWNTTAGTDLVITKL